MSDIYAHHSRIDVGTVWLRNAERWLSPSARGSEIDECLMTGIREPQQVETRQPPSMDRETLP